VHPWLARNLVYRPATWLRGERVFGLIREYERSQWWNPEQLRRSQEASLQSILRYAATRTAYYGDIVRELGLDPGRLVAADLERLPRLGKRQLADEVGRLQAWRLPGTTSWKTTGGSTGVPVRVRKNHHALACEQAASWRSYAWWGIRPGDRQARFWGTPISARARLRYRAIDFVMNRDRLSAFAFTRDDLRRYYAQLARSRPTWAYGYVSMLVEFVNFCSQEGLRASDLGVRAVVTTSEVLSEADRRLLTEGFGVPVCNEYGCGEVGAILYECPEGRLHLMAENLWVELDPDPTEQEPEACRLLVTDLHNRATPLLRYDLGDRVVPAGPCPCGRTLPAFSRVFGRAYDFVSAPDGSRFHGEFFLYALEAARDRGLPIAQAQFEQTAPGSILLRVVPGSGYAPEAGRWIANEVETQSRGRFQVEVAEVEEIPRERSGKIRLIKALPGAS